MTADELCALRVGDEFTYRGRTWVFADYAGWTWGEDDRGEYARFKVWPAPSNEARDRSMRFVTVRVR